MRQDTTLPDPAMIVFVIALIAIVSIVFLILSLLR
jgi:hypothetical protein